MRNEGGRKKPTPRRIEPKSTFGIYIPADIPSEACDFLNVLKDNGTFSTDVVEIVVQYLELRRFLDPENPLDRVEGNLLDQFKSKMTSPIQTDDTVDRQEAVWDTAIEAPSVVAETPSNPEPINPVPVNPAPTVDTAKTPENTTAGFDLNKVLQRMRRNKSIGSVNQLNNR